MPVVVGILAGVLYVTWSLVWLPCVTGLLTEGLCVTRSLAGVLCVTRSLAGVLCVTRSLAGVWCEVGVEPRTLAQCTTKLGYMCNADPTE